MLGSLCFAAFTLFGSQASAQQVTVRASIDSLQLLVGEQTKVHLEVSMDADKKLRLPVIKDTLVRGVEVLDIAKPDTQKLNDDKRWVITQEYTITSFDSALYYLPPLEVMVDDEKYRSESLALKVYSIPVDTLHPDQFFGPKTVVEVPIQWEDIDTMVYAFILMLLFGSACVFFIIRYRDNKPIIKIIKIEPKLPPHQEAMKHIEEIKANKNVQREDPKQYYTELTDVIRTYIMERFGFNAMEMTSSEIIENLLQVRDKESLKDLKYLFETADLVKFAKHAPMMNENDMNLVNAMDFINETKLEEDPNAKKEPTEIKVEEKRSKQGRIALMCSIGLTGVIAVVALYVGVKCIIDLFF
ncbi:BatD family protein [Bacteroides sp. ET336]|uniref:BatD family protein n=1 Tax=Bacteroides sp. ET336 TaxID=2972459 RepID=UPI0021AC0A85|nr:BatD family protein [Bacteroides sp. ET336]MCR8895108.1 BatD family protein [Bacteroides sp. ET336]MDN0059604.1 BatD family protein [Bacteroides caecigallinarum]